MHKLIDCKRQPFNLKRFLCSSNFSANKPTFKTTKCGESCFCCDYIIQAELFKFKNWHQPFVLKSNLNCENPNLIYAIICSGGNKEEYIEQTKAQLKERLSIYRQNTRQTEYEKLEVERPLRTCAKKIFKIFPFFKMKENNILRECYEDHFIKKFKPELNRRLQNPKN